MNGKFNGGENEIREAPEPVGNTVIRGVAVSGAGNVAMRALDVGLAVVLLRWLSLFDFGIYRLAIAAYDVGAGFFLAGVENVVVSDVARDLASNRRQAEVMFSTYFYFMLLTGAALAALFFFGATRLEIWFGVPARYLRIVSILFLIAPIDTAYKLKFQIFLDFGWGTIFRVSRNIIRLVVLIGALVFASFNVTVVLLSLVASVLGPVIIAGIWYRRESLRIFPAWSEMRIALAALFLRHGKWALADDLLNNWGQNVRPFILRAFAGPEAVALLSLAQSLVAYIKPLFPLREVLTPVLPRSADDPARLASQINRATKYATWGYVAVSIAGAVGAPILVYALFPKYLPALPYFYILLAGLPFFGFRSVALPVFFALKAQDVLFKISAARVFLLAVLNLALTYFFGIWGAATEMLLIGLLTTPAYAAALKRILPQWQFEWSELVRINQEDRGLVAAVLSRITRRFRA